MPSRPEIVEQFKKEFRRRKPIYEELAKEVEWALEKELEQRNIQVVHVIRRVKDESSGVNKILSKGYTVPLTQISDLAGVRIVYMYSADLPAIQDLIRAQFRVHDRVDKTKELGEDQMGYQGQSFVISLKDSYSGPRYDGLHGLKCEVQVRNIMQDAWAIISHNLDYKRQPAMPPEIRRQLNLVSGQLELAQQTFDTVRAKRQEYIAGLQKQSQAAERDDFLDQPVNSDTLLVYTQSTFQGMPVSPKWHARMVGDLDFGRYRTLRDVDRIVASTAPAVKAYAQQRPDLFQYGTDYLTKAFGFADPDFRQKHGWCEDTRSAFGEYSYPIDTTPLEYDD